MSSTRAQRRHPEPAEPSLLVSMVGTEHLLGITRPTVLKLIELGELTSIKVERRRFVTRASIEAYVNRRIAAAS